jgi:hypothetical protein
MELLELGRSDECVWCRLRLIVQVIGFPSSPGASVKTLKLKHHALGTVSEDAKTLSLERLSN